MIYVDRSVRPIPEGLSSSKVERARKEISEILGRYDASHLAQLRIPFDPKIWLSVKEDLLSVFNGKCAYCESLIPLGSLLEVEHFRPKQLSEEHEGQGRQHHYYAWLAYDWDNLLAVCATCNARKRGRFPLIGSRAPMLSTVEICRDHEIGSIIDPCFEDPGEHLVISSEGECVGRTPRGELTIDVIGLNRQELVRNRKQLYQSISSECAQLRALMLDRSSQKGVEILAKLAAMVSPKAAYAATARSCIWAELGGVVPQIEAIDPVLWSDVVRYLAVDLQAVPTIRAVPPGLRVSVQPGKFRGKALLPDRAMASITRIEICNFKAIEHIAFDIPPRSSSGLSSASSMVLLGENASGKSTVLQAVAMALLGTSHIKELKLDGRRFLRRDNQWNVVPSPAEVRLYFDGDPSHAVTLRVDSETGEFSGTELPQAVLIGYGARRFFASSHGRRRSVAASERIRTLFHPKATIQNPSGWLGRCRQSDFDAAVRALRQILVLPDDAFVRRVKADASSAGEVFVDVHGTSTPVDYLSEGYRTVVATAVDMMHHLLRYWPDLEQAQGVVLIDELETHLHPRWKMRILQRLRSALPRVQFVVTTHDPLCLRGALDGEVQVLDRIGQDRVHLVQDLPNVRGLTVEQLLTSSYFGLLSTEDPAFEADMIRFTALASKEARDVDEEGELTRLRSRIHRVVRIGQTPEERLVYESAATYLAQQREKSPVRDLDGAAIARMVEVWSSLKDRRGEP